MPSFFYSRRFGKFSRITSFISLTSVENVRIVPGTRRVVETRLLAIEVLWRDSLCMTWGMYDVLTMSHCPPVSHVRGHACCRSPSSCIIRSTSGVRIAAFNICPQQELDRTDFD